MTPDYRAPKRKREPRTRLGRFLRSVCDTCSLVAESAVMIVLAVVAVAGAVLALTVIVVWMATLLQEIV